MATKTWAIALILFMTLLTSAGQILFKLGAANFSFTLDGTLGNWQFLLALVVYAISSVMMVIALRGGDLSVLYPLIALSYVWVSILSQFILHDNMNFLKWAGVVSIIVGVSFIGMGGRK